MSCEDGNPGNTLSVDYLFKFENGEEKRFRVDLSPETLQILPPPAGELPEWTLLTYRQCPNCPLDQTKHKHCPVAVSLMDVIAGFGEATSYEWVEVTVRTKHRQYSKRTPLQYGVSALMGLIMVTSGCPWLDKLRPLVHSHLPFATVQETLYRFISMYLLAQYYLQEDGGTPDWKLERLPQMFEDIGLVNKSFCQRLVGVTRTSDAINNALVNLDCYALLSTMPLSDQMASIRAMFHAWQNVDHQPGS